jgi:primary-amine oxidase
VNRAIFAAGNAIRLIGVFLMLAAGSTPARSQPQAPPDQPVGATRASSGPNSSAISPASSADNHPLDPLGPDEIKRAVAIVKSARPVPETTRFVTVTLREPPKSSVMEPGRNGGVAREAFLVLLDTATGRGHEAVVDLRAQRLTRYDPLPEGVQPSITLDEFVECEEAARRSPEFRAALKKRGIDDLSLVMIDAWSAGHYGNEPAEDRGKRLTRALCWVRSEPTDNGYARPIEGMVAVIDLNRKEVVRVEDHGVVPLPPLAGNWARSFVKDVRTDLKPLDVSQSRGPSFTVRGHQVQWQKWSLRVGFNPREGLVLHTIAYDGRPILYRASIVEMIVPYADPRPSAYHKNAFDMGEYGVGMMANSLENGCDCLGTIHYFDGHVADGHGRPVTIKNAVCLHEEDAGLLWKHTDWRTGQSEVRRARRLTVSMIATVGNYDYVYYWHFHQDGTIQMEVKLTGIVNTTGLAAGETPRHGTEIAPRLSAPYHQHFFSARLDFSVDGEKNTVVEVNTKSSPPGPDNPHGNAYTTELTPLEKELAAQRTVNPLSSRFWRVINSERRNRLDQPVSYRLYPGENVLPFAQPDAAVLKRAGFLTKNVWVTPYDPDERYPTGDYPNQNPGGDGLPKWTKADRNIADRDLVVWYTFGQTHIPRVEDWPVMPVSSIGFLLRPDGFFDANPALDLPAPAP